MKQLYWTERALKDLQKIDLFNSELLGDNKASEITLKIIAKADFLENPSFDFTEIGAPDDDFSHLKRKYRKLIEGHYKITYRSGKSKIYINRIFDTRQNPKKNK
ncbi:type II toxin-antitoxin system RelE/ParE family toxin [Flavobacterium cyanobacteriorum]|nr:type II toxin-antitoxin system RelE/ParE family toxin [Flavobacterium cyanobacteriorum]